MRGAIFLSSWIIGNLFELRRCFIRFPHIETIIYQLIRELFFLARFRNYRPLRMSIRGHVIRCVVRRRQIYAC
jgi:hypothetical protein